MLRIFGKSELPRPLRNPIVTLGVFDGVHLGHQSLIREALAWANEIDGEFVIITFEQHPQVVLSGLQASSITSLEHRLVLFEKQGADVCVVFQFDQELAEVTAEEFAEEYFSRWLHARGVLLGFDCRFGKGARGNVDLLKSLAPQLGFEARAYEQVRPNDLIPSSTAIRSAITAGHLENASAMLGRPVSILGDVVHGDHRGRSLGFPTANIDPHHEILPPNGVYACQVHYRGAPYLAVTNIGTRPTVRDTATPTIETHLLNFQGDLYGQTIDVHFIKKLRDERKFNGLEELKTQIGKDIQAAEALLKKE